MRPGLAAVVLWAAVLSGAGFLQAGGTLAQQRPQLSLPLDCVPHKTCFIQNYVDDDPSNQAHDFGCGTATYDKHSGTDFRLLSLEPVKQGVAVRASADGVVKGRRDGVADKLLRESKPEDIKGRECGNGVVLDHGNGWETQYCHLKQGSVGAEPGQQVKRGDKLGEVGYSGAADFAHVHLSVRHENKVVDPFHPDSVNGSCLLDAKGAGMWVPAEIAKFPYRNGEIVSAGFAGEPPDHEALNVDHTKVASLTPQSPTLIFYARLINLAAGDRLRLTLNGPGGTLSEQLTEPFERPKASFTSYTGKKRRDGVWMTGRYTGLIEIVRDGAVTASSVAEVTLR